MDYLLAESDQMVPKVAIVLQLQIMGYVRNCAIGAVCLCVVLLGFNMPTDMSGITARSKAFFGVSPLTLANHMFLC